MFLFNNIGKYKYSRFLMNLDWSVQISMSIITRCYKIVNSKIFSKMKNGE